MLDVRLTTALAQLSLNQEKVGMQGRQAGWQGEAGLGLMQL
jgi:hypothetical protein